MAFLLITYSYILFGEKRFERFLPHSSTLILVLKKVPVALGAADALTSSLFFLLSLLRECGLRESDQKESTSGTSGSIP